MKRIFRPTTTKDFAGDGSHCASCSKKLEDHDLVTSDEKGVKFCLQCAHLNKLGMDEPKKFRGYETKLSDWDDPTPNTLDGDGIARD